MTGAYPERAVRYLPAVGEQGRQPLQVLLSATGTRGARYLHTSCHSFFCTHMCIISTYISDPPSPLRLPLYSHTLPGLTRFLSQASPESVGLDLPSRTRGERHNLLNNYLSALLLAFIDCGLIEVCRTCLRRAVWCGVVLCVVLCGVMWVHAMLSILRLLFTKLLLFPPLPLHPPSTPPTLCRRWSCSEASDATSSRARRRRKAVSLSRLLSC